MKPLPGTPRDDTSPKSAREGALKLILTLSLGQICGASPSNHTGISTSFACRYSPRLLA